MVGHRMGDEGVARGQKMVFECWNLIKLQNDQFHHKMDFIFVPSTAVWNTFSETLSVACVLGIENFVG